MLLGSYGHPGVAFTDGIPDDFVHGLFPDSVDDIAEVMEAALTHIPLLAEAGVQRFVNGPSVIRLMHCRFAGRPTAAQFYHACGIRVGITHSAAAGRQLPNGLPKVRPNGIFSMGSAPLW